MRRRAGLGASLPTVSERVKLWKSSAKDYWKDSEPQLTDLYSRLEAEGGAGMGVLSALSAWADGSAAFSRGAAVESGWQG